jgi:hypothetical protein
MVARHGVLLFMELLRCMAVDIPDAWRPLAPCSGNSEKTDLMIKNSWEQIRDLLSFVYFPVAPPLSHSFSHPGVDVMITT